MYSIMAIIHTHTSDVGWSFLFLRLAHAAKSSGEPRRLTHSLAHIWVNRETDTLRRRRRRRRRSHSDSLSPVLGGRDRRAV